MQMVFRLQRANLQVRNLRLAVNAIIILIGGWRMCLVLLGLNVIVGIHTFINLILLVNDQLNLIFELCSSYHSCGPTGVITAGVAIAAHARSSEDAGLWSPVSMLHLSNMFELLG
jgi:hypothetical protein